ncbi:hypothetical protein [Mycobacterium dioxanotrophicus]|uniref:hypothetical protein n=1 Tax=Mycobacterium dioxanotrophicus TaxID=482462 RepID=UPI0012F8573D|nr:hypothetical protein [Mycobacterium dioxanotrophicus]
MEVSGIIPVAEIVRRLAEMNRHSTFGEMAAYVSDTKPIALCLRARKPDDEVAQPAGHQDIVRCGQCGHSRADVHTDAADLRQVLAICEPVGDEYEVARPFTGRTVGDAQIAVQRIPVSPRTLRKSSPDFSSMVMAVDL